MDRSSRFQNPMPLTGGNFSKAPSIQSDGVGMKPLSVSILDRFRALVRDREDELRVFGGAVGLPLNASDIVRLYEIVLMELTINSKPIITDLTIIAGEQRAHGEGIADAICARIIEVPVDQKLPSLYLLDSIVKNIGKEYIRYFSANLPEVFCDAYAQVHPNMHSAMRHLFRTWATVIPLSVLRTIEAQLQFSPSLNGHSSSLSSSIASESPRPAHGIHINPKYLESQHHFGHSTVNTAGTERLSLTGRAGLASSGADAVKKVIPSAAGFTSRIVHGRPVSPSLEEFDVDGSPRRVSVMSSPSRLGIDYGPSRVLGKDKETSDWPKRKWQGDSNQPSKASSSYKHSSNGVDLSGPRALISAYGMDEREKKFNPNNQLDSNGAGQKVGIRTWQNTEEEEFDWEDINPALSDRKQSNEKYSSLPPLGNSMARHSRTTNHTSPLVTNFGGKLPKAQLSSVSNSSAVEDVSHIISSGHGSINKFGGIPSFASGLSDLPILPGVARESLKLPHQQSQSHFDGKGAGSFSGARSFLTAGEQNRPSSDRFITNDSPAPEIQPADSAKFQSSDVLVPLPALPQQMQIRGQFGMANAANIGVDESLNKPIHAKQVLGGMGTTVSEVTFPPIPSQHPGSMSMNLQNIAQPSPLQPNMFMGHGVRQNLMFPSSVPPPSNPTVQPFSYGYLMQAHGPPIGAASSNLVSGVRPSFPMLNPPNMPFNMPGAVLHSLPRGRFPGGIQALPTGPVAHTPPAGGALSGLFSSLMAQGLISATKQDSIGVDFDQDNLRVRHESPITALYGDLPRQCKSCGRRFKNQDDHSKHMDWHVNKNRTLKNRKTKPPPKWFVSVNMWLTGAEAMGTEVAPGFLPVENIVEKDVEEEMAVPADEEQNACALCGEPFEDFYSDEMEEWMYKGAVYMYAPPVSTAGMDRSQLGPIVHAKCRSDSQAIPSEDLNRNGGESTEDNSQRKQLRS